jgi:hypothetical protein
MDERRRIDGVGRRRREQQRVAVGLGVLDLDRADRAGGAGLVVDDHGLAQKSRHLLRGLAADDIGRAGRRERHDEAHDALGILALGADDGGRSQACQRRAQARRQKVTSFHFSPPFTQLLNYFSVSLNNSIMAFQDRRSVASW